MPDTFVVTFVGSDQIGRDISLTLPEGPTAAELVEALGDRVPEQTNGIVWNERTGSAISGANQTLIDLRHGDVLRLGDPLQRAFDLRPEGVVGSSQPTHAYRLESLGDDAVHGFDTTIQIGRRHEGPGRLRLEDGTVSVEHAVLRVEPYGVVLEDVGSSNGTFVNGRQITDQHKLTSGDEIDFGSSSQFRFVANDAAPQRKAEPVGPLRGGRVLLNRPPRTIVPSPTGVLKIGPAPPTRRSRRFPWASVLVPVMGGLAMYLGFGRNPMFLVFIAMGPLIAIWNFFESRSDESRQHAASVDAYKADLDQAKRGLSEGEELRQRWLDSVLPDTKAIISQIKTGQDLWERSPHHEDFGWIRVGSGSIPPMRTLEVEERGDSKLVELARELRDSSRRQSQGPLSFALLNEPVVGLVGRGERLDQAIVNLTLRLAARHSPAELAIIALTTNPSLDWVRWLPHAHAVPGLERAAVANDPDDCRSLFESVERLIERRLNGDEMALGPSGIPLPHLVLLVVPPVPVPSSSLASLMERSGAAGVSVVYVAPTLAALPNGCRAVLELDGTAALRHPATGTSVELEAVEGIDADLAETLARRLAAFVDEGAQAGSAAMPTSVSLCEVNEVSPLVSASNVLERWRSAPQQLVAPIGSTGDGPVQLGFESTREGPHILVAGTTRAGKSEFLQALVGGLALQYPPEDLNLLFVDWKGAATFRPFLGLPHTVGLLSDLDEGLADRALRSLRAELTYRKQVLQAAEVQKLDDLPRRTLPRLMVLFDEFAELIDNNPDFADGVVSVAQVGGSLGIHMVLAMQTPSGALNKKVENCINGRVVFRLKDRAESGSALGSPKAASIPAAYPGRGYFKDGSNRIIEFQSAYGGARSSVDEDQLAAETVGSHVAPQPALEGKTDLEALAEAIEAAGATRPTKKRPPWVAPLPELVSLDQLPRVQPGKADAVVGLLDDPDRQIQAPYSLDLNLMRNVLVAGAGGSGRTTVLRTVVDGLARSQPPSDLSAYCIDFGGGLETLASIPHIGGVVPGGDSERLRRLLAMVSSTIEQRRTALSMSAPSGATGASAGQPVASGPKVVLIVDGLVPLLTELSELDHGIWTGVLQSFMSEGPGLGVHVVAATDDPLLRQSVLNLFGERLVLHQTLRDGYSNLGVAGLPLTSQQPGRALSSLHRLEVQIGTPAGIGRHETQEQIEDIRARWQGTRQVARSVNILPPVLRPPTTLPVNPEPMTVIAGIDDVALEPRHLDLARQPLIIVAGPDLSGRTSTLAWIRQQLEAQGPLRSERLLIGKGTTPEPGWTGESRGAPGILECLQGLEGETFDGVTLLAFDDADPFLDMTPAATPEDREARRVLDEIGQLMNRLVDEARGRKLVVVVGGRMTDLGRGQGWLKRARESKQAIVLSPASLGTTAADAVFGVKYPRRTGYSPRPGLGVLIRGADTALVQVPYVGLDPQG
ncbi:MAG: FHA domain-containing protein [Actinomycetia bacterium]|nr:FHA domain-containing protein [Actinomycetes bacterium]